MMIVKKLLKFCGIFKVIPRFFSTAKIPISEQATGTLIMLGKLKYEENVTEDMDYILRVYKDFKKEYEKGNLEL